MIKSLRIAFVVLLLASFASCTGQQNDNKKADTNAIDSNKHPKIALDKADHDFGTIAEGEVVEWTYDFTNTGDGDLVITNVEVSCGCTVPDWPKEPIKPGQRSSIKVKFDSHGKEGQQKKTVTVKANTIPNSTFITFTANVIKKEVK